MEFNKTQKYILAAGTLALIDEYDTAFFITNLLSDIFKGKPIQIMALTDNQLLHETGKTNKLTLDCRLREICDKCERSTNWISKHH